MIAMVVAARALRRPVRVGDVLALAAMAMLLFDPLAALTAGFWLSFAGVDWLAWCLPDAGKRLVGAFLSAPGGAHLGLLPLHRKSGVWGKRGSVRVRLGGCRIYNKNN